MKRERERVKEKKEHVEEYTIGKQGNA